MAWTISQPSYVSNLCSFWFEHSCFQWLSFHLTVKTSTYRPWEIPYTDWRVLPFENMQRLDKKFIYTEVLSNIFIELWIRKKCSRFLSKRGQSSKGFQVYTNWFSFSCWLPKQYFDSAIIKFENEKDLCAGELLI